MYIATIYTPTPFAPRMEWKEEITLPESVTSEVDAVEYLTNKGIEKFTLFEVVRLGSYEPKKPKVVKVS